MHSLASRRGLAFVWVPLIAVALLHYLTPAHPHWVHDVARRLYYVPIVLGGTLAGVRGGGLTALVTLALYAPHAFLFHQAMDPGTSSEKALEMGFYLLLGLASGLVSDRVAAEARLQAVLTADLQRTLDQVRAKDAELARAARLESLGELTAGLAHEIRNPLHAMRGSAEILLDAVPKDSREHELGARWIVEIDRLSSVLTRFLDFAKGSAPAVERTSLWEVTRHVGELIEAQARRQESTVSLPAPDARAVAADHDQLVQVVLGLCINALQALDRGGTIDLGVETVRDGEVVFHAIRVANDGPVIPESALDRVFDPFFSTRDGGTGLGLSVAWRIIAAHGGRLEVENLPNSGGVVFRVLLPAWVSKR